jgi:hypothetical protein
MSLTMTTSGPHVAKPKQGTANVDIARQCLGLIRDIVDRGASSWDPTVVGYALQELSQVLLERTGEEDRRFEPVRADEIHNLDALLAELQWVEGFSREMCRSSRCH